MRAFQLKTCMRACWHRRNMANLPSDDLNIEGSLDVSKPLAWCASPQLVAPQHPVEGAPVKASGFCRGGHIVFVPAKQLFKVPFLERIASISKGLGCAGASGARRFN